MKFRERIHAIFKKSSLTELHNYCRVSVSHLGVLIRFNP